ncbi:MAG TPA: nitrous oxide reductase family maturation protein NosD [Hyphomicrobium sp.]|nr:nitrous oxide reductase family maturation protein NosD [Hyphomicrobium sp.]
MAQRPRALPMLIAGLVLAIGVSAARAAEISVRPGAGNLAAAIAQAAAGDRLVLAPGVHHGGVVIEKPLTLRGESGSVVDAGGTGTAIKILSPDVSVQGLTIRGSGTRGENFDSGLYLEQGADRASIEDNRLEGNLFGIVLHGTKSAAVRNNFISNRSDLWPNDRGNGIHIWNNGGTLIEGNHVTSGRDGIYIEASHRNVIRGNRFDGLRFAIHYMYANNNEITDNISIRNRVGFALMYSKNLKVYRNLSVADLNHGLMLHTTYKSDIAQNYVYGTGEKGLFVYTSAGNSIRDNRFEQCGIGVHFTGGSENNTLYGNSFLANEFQVKYTGMRTYEWSHKGRGNYWSDNPAFDLDGDGVADSAYRPNTLVDWVLWRYPLAKLLIASPAIRTLRFVQEQLPTLYPGGAVDSFPLMTPGSPPVAIPAGLDLTPAPRDPAQAGSDSRPIM